MAKYVEGFVVPVRKSKLEEYRKISKTFGKVYREFGALEYNECIADDVKKGKVTSFPQSVKLKAGEVVIFSWVVFKSRAHRDRVNNKAMKDPRFIKALENKPLPFDGMRMFWGGFKSFVSM